MKKFGQKNSQPFGKKCQKSLGGIFLTHTVEKAVIDRNRCQARAMPHAHSVIEHVTNSIRICHFL